MTAPSTPLTIGFCCTDTKPEPWVEGLHEALRAVSLEARVEVWRPGEGVGSGASPARYAVVWAPPQAFLDEQSQLRALFNIGAGVDALLRLKVSPSTLVVRLDDAGMSVQMAEYVCQAVIRHFRELHEVEAEARQGRWTFRKPRERADFAVGVLGCGVLGARVASALRTFEFPVLAWSRTPKTLDGVECHHGAQGLAAMLPRCQVLVNLLPLTDQTRDLLDARLFAQLPRGAAIVNVARGAHLVDEDLLAALDSGHLSGATLDVFRTEPLPADHAFWRHPRITVTPHTSARTLRSQSIAQIVGKIAALERGQPIAGVVDRARGY